MAYETLDLQELRIINVTITSAHYDCKRNSCKKWVWSKMCRRCDHLYGNEPKCDTKDS